MHSHPKHTIHRGHIHHGWNNAFPPVLKIAPGETIQFETKDASSGQLTKTSTAADVAKLDFAMVNPVTGPVFVDGAEPGDALKVTIETSSRPASAGRQHPGLRPARRPVQGAGAASSGTTTRVADAGAVRAERRACR